MFFRIRIFGRRIILFSRLVLSLEAGIVRSKVIRVEKICDDKDTKSNLLTKSQNALCAVKGTGKSGK